MKVLRISHSSVVEAWRERERKMRDRGHQVRLISAGSWNEGGVNVPFRPRSDEDAAGAATIGTHPALFLFDPRVLWRSFAQDWDVLDIHEEAYALATAEVLAVRRLRHTWDRLRGRRRPPLGPFVLYSAQNLDKVYPLPIRWMERSILRRAGGLYVANLAATQIERRKGARGPVVLIPLGVDTDIFSPGPQPVGSDGRIVVGYAGRFTRQKGVDVLLRAVADNPEVTVLLAGAGPEEANLRALAAPLGDRVRFVGSLGLTELVHFYRSLTVLAVPSVNAPGLVEQFGRVAVEAMACGTPVIATRTGSLADIVEGAGLVIPTDDVGALREAIVQVGSDPAFAAELRSAGVGRARQCSWDEVAEAQLALYRTVLGEQPNEDGSDTATSGSESSVATRVLPSVMVVVVAYGQPELLERSLAPLAGKYPITVVDNSSFDVIREVTQRFGATYIDPGRNLGFAGGVNLALRGRTLGEDVLLLNPDAVIAPDDVEVLRRELHADRRIASVGPTQVDERGTPARVTWPLPSPARAWLDAVGLGRIGLPEEPSFVIGSVLLLNGMTVDLIGGFDERFFLYAEETDWARRAVENGWRNLEVGAASAVHSGGASSSDPTRRTTHFLASQERYYRKHYGARGWQASRAAGIVGAGVRAVVRRGDDRSVELTRLRILASGPVRTEGHVRHGG